MKNGTRNPIRIEPDQNLDRYLLKNNCCFRISRRYLYRGWYYSTPTDVINITTVAASAETVVTSTQAVVTSREIETLDRSRDSVDKTLTGAALKSDKDSCKYEIADRARKSERPHDQSASHLCYPQSFKKN